MRDSQRIPISFSRLQHRC